MVAISAPVAVKPLHPLHAIFLSFPFAFFLGALLSDFAYWKTFHVQWANFSSWLIAGGLLFGGFALLWALFDLLRGRAASRRHLALYFVLLLATWVLGFINALVHAKDAWATMPEGLYLSAITTVLALAAAWVGYGRVRAREIR